MIRKVYTLVAAAILLCGCVLQSHSPLYDDRQSKPALGANGGEAVTSTLKDGQWVRDGDVFKAKVVGNHYEVTAGKSLVTLRFVPLQDSWFVLQATGDEQLTAYLLARISGNAAITYPIACRDLKQRSKLLAWIDFEGDDCFIKPTAPLRQLFSEVLKDPGEPSSRLEIR